MTRTYAGEPAGKGAKYRRVGNKTVREGGMTILDTPPDQRIEIELQVSRPCAATDTTTFTLEPDADTTRVTWAMEGQNKFMAEAFGVFVNMDQPVGRDVERGLDALADASTKPGVGTGRVLP